MEDQPQIKVIGGYFGLECGNNPLYYKDGIYLNSCRNAIRYLIRAWGIKKIHIPVFTCSAVEEAINKEHCRIIKYNIDENFFPFQNIPQNDFLIYNNYFGLTTKKVKQLSKIFPNLIVDNAQAFFANQYGRASIYSLRKFFGVPDGGIIRGEDIPELPIDKSVSYNVMTHLLVRKDLGAQAGYPFFIKDEESIDIFPVKSISKLTRSLLGNIDYSKVIRKRLENYKYLSDKLCSIFHINKNEKDVPLVYPYFVNNGDEIRKKLISCNIFCARYWPNVLQDKSVTPFEMNMAKNIISLPVDQRYGKEEMDYLLKKLQ